MTLISSKPVVSPMPWQARTKVNGEYTKKKSNRRSEQEHSTDSPRADKILYTFLSNCDTLVRLFVLTKAQLPFYFCQPG